MLVFLILVNEEAVLGECEKLDADKIVELGEQDGPLMLASDDLLDIVGRRLFRLNLEQHARTAASQTHLLISLVFHFPKLFLTIL